MSIFLEKNSSVLYKQWISSHCFFVFLFFIASTTVSIGQTSGFTNTNYSITEGLSHYKIQSIFKDSDGYLWIGTEDGLNKFDGVNFTLFINDPEDINSLSSGNLYAIDQDDKGRIWVGVDGGGVNIIDSKTYKITKIFSDDAIYRAKYIKDIYIDKSNIAWIGAWGGLIRYNIQTDQYVVYTEKAGENSIISSDIKKIVEDSSGLLWIATAKGLASFDKTSNTFTNYSLIHVNKPSGNSSIENLFCDANDQLWLSTADNKIFSFDTFKKEFTSYNVNLSNKKINYTNCFYEDSDNKIYMGNNDGIYVFDSTKIGFKREFVNSGIFSTGITVIKKDVDNTFLIGSETKGLYVLKKNHFKTISIPSVRFTNNRVRTIIKGGENSILFGARNGSVALFDRIHNKITKVIDHHLFNDYIIESLLVDSKGDMWVGTYNNGLFHYNVRTKKTTHVFKEKVRIEVLFESEDDVLWIATNTKVRFYDLKKEVEISAPSRYMLSQEMLNSHQVHFIETDKRGRIWYNVGAEVYLLDLAKGKSERLESIQDDYEYISFEDTDNGTYYLGTLNGGVVIINANEEIKTITEKKGLVSNRVTSILSDKCNNIWYSTTKGIGVFGKNRENVFETYNSSNGIKYLDYYLGAAYKDESGWMYFGGVGGITYFHPDSLSNKVNTTKTIISDISINNKDVRKDTIISFKKKLVLDYKQNFLNIKFNSLDYSNKGNYKYRLIGLNDEWSFETNLNEVSYANLKPGDYTFQVISSSIEGRWSHIPAQIDIIITPPFWQRSWFYLIIACLTMGIIFMGVKIRERKLKQKVETTQFKLQALRSQMNPHFIFNSLNSIQHFIIKNDTKFALKYLTKFSKLVRKILENSFHIHIPLSEEIQFLSNYIEIESLRFDNQIDYSIEVDEKISPDDIEIPSMLIQPYVENSILHGLMHKQSGGVINIRFIARQKSIKCIIEDDGVGREVSKRINKTIGKTHNSYGLPITKSRLEELNKNRGAQVTVVIEDVIEHTSVKGTRVILNIPTD